VEIEAKGASGTVSERRERAGVACRRRVRVRGGKQGLHVRGKDKEIGRPCMTGIPAQLVVFQFLLFSSL
jgi:hypothetical protein